MKNKNYFPMFIDLSDKNVLVVGGGKIAYRRILALLQFTRNINVVTAQPGPEIQELSKLAAGSKRQEIGPCGSISCDRSHHGS